MSCSLVGNLGHVAVVVVGVVSHCLESSVWQCHGIGAWGNVLYCTVLYCTVLYCTVLYCTVLYCNALHCVLYCTVLWEHSTKNCTLYNRFWSVYCDRQSPLLCVVNRHNRLNQTTRRINDKRNIVVYFKSAMNRSKEYIATLFWCSSPMLQYCSYL